MKNHLIVKPVVFMLATRYEQDLGARQAKVNRERTFEVQMHEDCVRCSHRVTSATAMDAQEATAYRARCGAHKCEKAKHTKDGPMPGYLEHKKKMEEDQDRLEKLLLIQKILEEDEATRRLDRQRDDFQKIIGAKPRPPVKTKSAPSKNIPDHPDAGSW